MSTFTIDFFELSFLAEACIPPRPIARTCFWHDLINKHYKTMSEGECARLYDWISRSPQFNLENEDCLWFANRFNPDNQYIVNTVFENEEAVYQAFKHKDRYYTSMTTFIEPVYIVSAMLCAGEKKNKQ